MICTHAAAMIAMGRVLTGKMPEDPNEEDFRCGTCALSTFRRKDSSSKNEEVATWTPEMINAIPEVAWRGHGVQGGWECSSNGDCSFLKNGEERTWRFSGDESFMDFPALDSTLEPITMDGTKSKM